MLRAEKIAVATTALLFVPLIVVASVTHDRWIGIVGLAVACFGNATVFWMRRRHPPDAREDARSDDGA
jgi:hypothetical protein